MLGIVDTGAGIVKFADDVSIFGIDPDGQQAAAATLHHGVGGVVDDVQIDLLHLMRIGDHRRQGGMKISLDHDVVDLQIVIAQGDGIFDNVAQIDMRFMGLVLAGKRQQILHDSLGPLGLLVKFPHIIGAALFQLLHFQKLRVADDGGQRIIQFVSNARDQLADGRHLLALQKLFLGAAQVLIRFSGFVVELDFLNGGGKLATNADQYALVGGAEFALRPAAGAQQTQNFFLAPQDHPEP